MEIEIGRGKKARRAYGFDDIAIVPSRRTRDPDDVDISWKLGDYRFELPLLASAMDGVVSPATAKIVGRVPATVFHPVPNVESALVRIDRRPAPAVGPDVDPEWLFQLVKAGFGQRRKMLRRSLAALVAAEAFVAATAAATGVPPTPPARGLFVRQRP